MITESQTHREFLLEGLTILKNRGYDSAGIATMTGNPTDGLVSTFYKEWLICIIYSNTPYIVSLSFDIHTL